VRIAAVLNFPILIPSDSNGFLGCSKKSDPHGHGMAGGFLEVYRYGRSRGQHQVVLNVFCLVFLISDQNWVVVSKIFDFHPENWGR